MRQNRSKDTSESTERNYAEVLEIVEQLAEILDRADLSEVRIRDNEFEVQVSRDRGSPVGDAQLPRTAVPPVAAQPPVERESESAGSADTESSIISAPMPSRFYRSPAPDEPPLVNIGDIVEIGEPVAVLEVMKTYNPVDAPFTCEILEILAEDGDSVEYAQPLFRVKKI